MKDLILTLLISLIGVARGSCGGFVKLTLQADNGNMRSPMYPDSYPNYTHCVWLIEAPKEYGINLTIHSVQGQISSTGECIDRLTVSEEVRGSNPPTLHDLKIRNGSKVENLLAEYCLTDEAHIVKSRTRWLWVEFWTDGHITNKGFRASYSLLPYPGSTIFNSPVVQCQSMNFKCANKECISWAYHCDAVNDCGCIGQGCDEYGCHGFEWSTTSRLVLGGFLGVIVFVLVFVGIGCFDILWKEHTESEFQRQMDQAKKQARQNRNKPTPSDVIMQATGGTIGGSPGADSVKFDVPASPSLSTA